MADGKPPELLQVVREMMEENRKPTDEHVSSGGWCAELRSNELHVLICSSNFNVLSSF